MLNNISRYNKSELTEITGLKIGPGDTLCNKYVVTVLFVVDENSYDDVVWFDVDDEARLLEFLNFLHRCSKYNLSTRGRDDYRSIEGYSRWVEGEEIEEYDDDGEERTEEQMEALREDQILEWPFWEEEWSARLETVEVVFFDEHGLERSVQLITQ